MALTITNEEMHVVGDQRVWYCTATFDSSYLTGGELLTIALLSGCKEILHVICGAPSLDDEALSGVQWVRATGGLLVIAAAGTEEGSTTNLAATTCELVVYGK